MILVGWWMQILSSLHFPQPSKIFKRVVFLLCISYIDQCSFNTLNKNLLKDYKLKGWQDMKKVSKEAVLPSLQSNLKLFTLLLKGFVLSCCEFNYTVPSYNLHIINYMPTWKWINPHYLALMSPEKNSMQFNQLLMSWFRVKSMKMSMWFLSYHHASCIAHSPGEWAHMHFKNMVFSFNPWTRQRGTMVFSSWTSTVTYTFYCIILVYHLSPLNWGFSKKILRRGKKIKLKALT